MLGVHRIQVGDRCRRSVGECTIPDAVARFILQ